MMTPDSNSRSRWLPPEAELSEKFILTGGPGGQHVNKTESGVQLRFDVLASQFLSEEVRARLIRLAGRRVDSEGVLTIEARSHRSQLRNREDARERLADLIERAHHKPRKRIATRPSRAAKKKRLEGKRQRGGVKQARRKPGVE
ncbi:MAG: alternative ribosome rescue aminoacyl-tRNA hydrolase ArfB [Wenzhouxiangella sp.]